MSLVLIRLLSPLTGCPIRRHMNGCPSPPPLRGLRAPLGYSRPTLKAVRVTRGLQSGKMALATRSLTAHAGLRRRRAERTEQNYTAPQPPRPHGSLPDAPVGVSHPFTDLSPRGRARRLTGAVSGKTERQRESRDARVQGRPQRSPPARNPSLVSPAKRCWERCFTAPPATAVGGNCVGAATRPQPGNTLAAIQPT